MHCFFTGVWNCTYMVVWTAHGRLLGAVCRCWIWHADHLSHDTRSMLSAGCFAIPSHRPLLLS